VFDKQHALRSILVVLFKEKNGVLPNKLLKIILKKYKNVAFLKKKVSLHMAKNPNKEYWSMS